MWAVRVCTNLVSRLLFFVGCLSPGPRKNDLTNHWALGPFVRPFTSLVDPGDIYPPHLRDYGYKLTKVPLLCDNESAIKTTAVGVSEALYAKAVSPFLLPGNRWGQLMCVGTECLAMSCVQVYLARFKNSIRIVYFSQLMRLLDPLYCVE
jgi:hypothetical protein